MPETPDVTESAAPVRPERDRPWVMRTYAGHSSAAASNALYRRNLAKGQTGLSVAFDLPTQTGYDPDHVLSRGEVGKVGVPICHLGDMRALFDQIPLDQMNTSMTINATAMWMLALYQVVAARRWGVTGDDAWKGLPSQWGPVAQALTLAQLAGAPPAETIRRAAADLRRDRRAALERAAARLPVFLVIPLGTVFMPAFVLIAVVPLVVALATQTLGQA